MPRHHDRRRTPLLRRSARIVPTTPDNFVVVDTQAECGEGTRPVKVVPDQVGGLLKNSVVVERRREPLEAAAIGMPSGEQELLAV